MIGRFVVVALVVVPTAIALSLVLPQAPAWLLSFAIGVVGGVWASANA